MSPVGQTVIVGVLIAGAAGYLAWTFWKAFFGPKESGCGCGTSSCSAKSDIERLMKKARKQARQRAREAEPR